MRTHELKTDPIVFQMSVNGVKPYEIRLNDRDFQVGDMCWLRETKYSGASMKVDGFPLEYTGREMTKEITNIVSGYGLADGWVILTLKDSEQPWRCFMCDEVFTTEQTAAEHFGTRQSHQPACTINIKEYRKMEARMERYNEEDADIHRAMYRQQGEHSEALLREEEKGYARGLDDAYKHVPKPDPISPEIQDLLIREISRAILEDYEADGFAMEMLDQYGFVRAPDGFQPNEDPAMLQQVYMANGATIFGLMCVLGYGRKKKNA